MPQTRIEQDMHVAGHLSCSTLGVPAGTISNAAVNPSADISADKMEHRTHATYAQAAGSAAAAETRVIHTVYGLTGEIQSFKAGCATLCTGTATITVDLKKNGTSVLTAPIVLDSGNTVYVLEAGTLADDTLAAGDVLTVVVAVAAGSGAVGNGVYAHAVIDEKAA